MNAYEAYKKYVALKLHFQQDNYDYFKFSGSVKVNKETFENRRDKYFFQRLAKLYKDDQYEQLLVSNFITNSDIWIGDILSDDSRKIYDEWKKNNQSLTYIFSEDMIKIKEHLDKSDLKTFDSLFLVKDIWPEIITMTMQKTICLESLIIMNKILNFIPRINSKIKDELIWPNFKRLCLKYSPFVTADLNRCKKSMKDIFLSNPLDKSL
jgi:hypothetical protein